MEFQPLFENLLRNTLVLSRTAKTGTTSAEGRTDKPGSTLTPEQLMDQVRLNTAAATGVLLMALNSRHIFLQLEQTLFGVLSQGLTVHAMYRQIPTGKRYGVDPLLIVEDMGAFVLALEKRIHAKRDPIETAAWVEFEIDHRIHPYSDACGRMARTLSTWALLRMNAPLPVHRDRAAYYAAMNTSWDAFLTHYRTCFGGA